MVLKIPFSYNYRLRFLHFLSNSISSFMKSWKVLVPGVKLKKSAICSPVNVTNFICLTGCSSDGESQHSGGGDTREKYAIIKFVSPGLDFHIPVFHSIPSHCVDHFLRC